MDLLNVKKTQRGLRRILTDRSLRVKKHNEDNEVHTDVFALGDAADVEGSPLPTTAEVCDSKGSISGSALETERPEARKSTCHFLCINRKA